MPIGYKLGTEGLGPKELIRQAVLAGQAGFGPDAYDSWHLKLEDARVSGMPAELPVTAAADGEPDPKRHLDIVANAAEDLDQAHP